VRTERRGREKETDLFEESNVTESRASKIGRGKSRGKSNNMLLKGSLLLLEEFLDLCLQLGHCVPQLIDL
jgi:hypothetical protein